MDEYNGMVFAAIGVEAETGDEAVDSIMGKLYELNTITFAAVGTDDPFAHATNQILEIIQGEIARVSNPMLVDREYIDGLEEAITLIKEAML